MDGLRIVKIVFYAGGLFFLLIAFFSYLYDAIFSLPREVKAVLLVILTLIIYTLGLVLLERDV